MANPNIVNVTTILGKTSVLAVTTTPTDIVVNAAASDTVLKINNLTVANIDGTNAADITASIFRGSVEYRFANTISVPADSSLVILDKNTSIYLEEGDSIRLTASANGDLQGIVSYEVIS
jgi:hypothetical protein